MAAFMSALICVKRGVEAVEAVEAVELYLKLRKQTRVRRLDSRNILKTKLDLAAQKTKNKGRQGQLVVPNGKCRACATVAR